MLLQSGVRAFDTVRLRRLADRALQQQLALPAYCLLCMSLGLVRFVPGSNAVLPGANQLWWDYLQPVVAVNYFDSGFVRRSLIGTVTTLLGVAPTVETVQVVYALGVVFAALATCPFAWRATRSLRSGERALLLAMFAFSPGLFAHWTITLRPDAWVVAFAALAAIAASRRRYLLAGLAAMIAGLLHESFFIIFGPLFLAIADERRRQGGIDRDELMRAGAVLVGLGALFVYLLVFGHPQIASLAGASQRTGVPIEIKGENPFYSFMGFEARQPQWVACMMGNDPTRILRALPCLGLVIVQAVALFGWSDRVRLSLALAPTASVIVMAFMAMDNGRYTAMAVAGLWLYFFIVVEREGPRSVLRPISACVLAAFTLLGPMEMTNGFVSESLVLKYLVGPVSIAGVTSQARPGLLARCNGALPDVRRYLSASPMRPRRPAAGGRGRS